MRIPRTPALTAALVSLFATATTPALAADYSDPTWPCIQRKVERLSVGLMWPAPLEEVDLAPETGRAVEELAETLALRRVDLESARAAVEEFAEAQGRDMALMGAVFKRVFDTLSTRRRRIIDGIEEFSLSQIALSDRIDAARSEMTAEMDKSEPDFDRVDTLEEQVDWDQRIYSDRQQNITYLCETPVLLDKRLYALAQMLQEAARSEG
ncbi:hypothetical protein [Salipiger mucosus]|uniref:Uncharacterized protein n=1 Tax=Salipiger mucosus DSM 16094 TaxID=1123237 RepID=S9RQ53_9RHOB|nr:hypothetical protein [Salipiger mucosus]EPX76119.1 hypothetical protein Salmuc_00772 [Salipiger mucosus DSM 16094]